MSQPVQRSQLDWLLHTFLVDQLTAAGLTTEAAQVASVPPITSDPRLANAQTTLLAYLREQQATFDPALGVHWQAVSDLMWSDYEAAQPNWIQDIYSDLTDPAVFAFLKLCMSTLGVLLTRAAGTG